MDGNERNLKLAVLRGLRSRCPNCGKGRLFLRWLRPVDHCTCCGTRLRRDDAAYSAELAPAFLVQSVVSIPIGVGTVMAATSTGTLPWMAILFLIILAAVLSAGTLQPSKGAVIGFQWAERLDDFAGTDEAYAPIDRAAPELKRPGGDGAD